MPATANEKEIARSADHALTDTQATRKNIEYCLRDLTRLEERYAQGKKMEDWAPQRLKELAKARSSAVTMYTGYYHLIQAGGEQLDAQREGVTIRRATGTAHALVAAGKIAECFISGAKVLRKFEKVFKSSKFLKKASEVKTYFDVTKDATEAYRSATSGNSKNATDKGAQATLKLFEATRDFADIVDSVFAMAGLSEGKPDSSIKSAGDLMAKMMKATKALLIACREAEKSKLLRTGASQKVIQNAADHFGDGMESLGIIANIIEALIAITKAIEEFESANKLAEVAVKQEAFNTRIGGNALTAKQIMFLRVAVGAETGSTNLDDIRKSITSLTSGLAATRELNDTYFALETTYAHAQTHVTGFSAAYSRRLGFLQKFQDTAQTQLPKLMSAYESAVDEQKAGGTGWRGAIGFLPERMNSEIIMLVNAMTRAHMRLYC